MEDRGDINPRHTEGKRTGSESSLSLGTCECNSEGLPSLRMWEGGEFSGLRTLENKGQTQIELGVIILHKRTFNTFFSSLLQDS